MNKFDELTNKYFDNDISQNELTELNEYLKNPNNELLFRATQNLEFVLKQGEYFHAPEMFREKFMDKILFHKKKAEAFPIFISAIFILLILLVIVFAFLLADLNVGLFELSVKIERFFQNTDISSIRFSWFVKNKIVMIIGLSSSFFLLLNFFFSAIAHKSFKEKINKYSGCQFTKNISI
jgi:hypothetical protein